MLEDLQLELGAQSARAAFRCSCRYLLRGLANPSSQAMGEVNSAAIMIALMSANIAHIDNDPELRHAYAAYDSAPPDDIRRPATGLAVAKRLALPRETVRRQIKALVEAGLCQKTQGGYLVPLARINSLAHRTSAATNLADVRQLLRDLQRLAPEGGWPVVTRGSPADLFPDPPLRLVNRRTAEFGLDLMTHLAAAAGGYEEFVAYMAIVEATDRHAEGEPPRSASVNMIAQSLGMPYESVRRRVARVAERGLIARTGRGYTAGVEWGEDPALQTLVRANTRALRRLFGDLARFGVALA